MALTNLSQVTSSGIHTLSNYTTHNINSTGIITATEFSGNLSNSSGISTFAEIRVTGNLTVEGTTTTLDSNLTEVDRIEVAANSTNPAIAVTQSGSGDILNLFDGANEVFTVKDGGNVGIGTDNTVDQLTLGHTNNQLLGFETDNEPTIQSYNAKLHINTAGNDVVFDGTGKVGIGENTPGTILHIKKNDATGPTITLENGSNETYINNWGSSGPSGRTNRFEINAVLTSSLALAGQYISLQTGAAGDSNERLRITSGGNIGIGTVTPLALYRSLSIHGPANDQGGVLDLATKDRSSRGYVFNDSNGLFVQTATNHPIILRTNNTERLRITSGGGLKFISADSPTSTTEPAQWLNHSGGMQLYGSSGTSTHRNIIFCSASNAASERLRIASDGNITLGYSGNSLWFQNGFNNRASRIQNGGGSGSADLKFYTNNAGTEAERLRITSDGKIVTSGGAAVGTLTLAGDNKDITFGRTQNSGTGGVGRLVATGNIVYLQAGANASSGSAADLVFGAYGGVGEKMRIKSDGLVGIGEVTPETLLHLSKNGGQATITLEDPSNSMKATLSAGTTRLDMGTPGSHAISFFTNNTHRLRLTNTGLVGIGTIAPFNNTSDVDIRGGSSAISDGGQIVTIGLNTKADNTPQLAFGVSDADGYGWIRSYASGVGGKDLVFASVAENLRITSAGKVGINTSNPSYKLHVKETTSASNYAFVENTTTGNAGVRLKNSQGDFVLFVSPDLRIYDFANSRDRLRISNNGRIGINADPTSYANSDSALGLLVKNGHTSSDHTFLDIQNGTSESGRIRFVDGDNGIGGQIYFAHNTARGGVGGNCMGFFTANNVLRMQVTTTGVDVSGSTDGVLNLDTTDQRGSFIRFRENGTTKGWAGCSEGIGTGGDQDDFGIRAVGGYRLRTGNNNSIEITDEGQIALRPMTGGFTTQGAQHTYPGAAVSIHCSGVGAGTGTNIPQYGLYVNASQSSNDATLMTGIYARAKQNTEGAAIGVHGLYDRDWNSYARKIGGLFQAPTRAPRYSVKSFNPGGGIFANTTSTGQTNALATGGDQPDGTTPTNATYGDATALWGDAFRSDTDTSNNHCDSFAIKATNRVTHGRNRTGLMVGIVDGNDTTDNSKNTQFVEYYTNSTHQRYYARNHKKQINEHYPLHTNSANGSYTALYNQRTAVYYYNRPVGYNQYSWYYFNTMGSSSARGGRLKIDISWTTGHASGSGEGTYSICYVSKHSDSRVGVQRFTRYHQFNTGGSYYSWSSSPHLDIFESTDTGSDAGIWFRVRGHNSHNGGTYEAYTVHSFKIEASESNYNFAKDCSFKFVSNSTPSSASASAVTISTPLAS